MKKINELEKTFIKFSEERAAFLEKADSKNANKSFDKLFKVIKELKSLGAPGIASLKNLMLHNNTWVAINAAGTLRKEMPMESKKILKKISEQSFGLPAAEAILVLGVMEHEDVLSKDNGKVDNNK
jgi:hypothetical protein